MPKYCAGLEDPAGGAARPCLFAQDGRGGPAQPTGTRCVLCCVDTLQRALSSRVGKGNLQRLLKHWRRIKSPVYQAAFDLGSLCALSTNEQCLLRTRAGEESKFELRTSWLHKKKQRLKHFVMGRPIPAASPGISEGSQKYLKAAARWRQGNRDFRLHWTYVHYRKKEPFTNVKMKRKCRTHWRGKHTVARALRREWWKARRTLKAKYLASMAAGPPFRKSGLKWAMEEGILQAGIQVPLSSGAAHLCQPRWCFLTLAGDTLYFESFDDRKRFKTKQLQSAKVSINNAFGRVEYSIEQEEYVHEWDSIRNGVIFSPLCVGNMLERLGFKLQLLREYSAWPTGAISLLQIRSTTENSRFYDYWTALKSFEDRVYLLDAFRRGPALIGNMQHTVQIYTTYAVVPF
ncbi:POL [Symbiodinium natans]|uniref:POL protein n=1 Tax=Symbiodinium natans TaxID=878477 RepID=A0A812LA70_9DINO|nr:POL [Symbiodinium natans]CAE7242480.1 POL [Symbiodinium natans]